ncbi:MAG: 50S ribosomal protein L25/general stress protein Ctc [Thermodesulfobacteriota bacterium]|nr:50S ribosomal protein L25/general stress protein Ctc [Thermodesulfobacteriota bacterium]
MEQITLGAQLRTEFGKGAARKLRRAEQIPAVLYGHGIAPIALTIDSHQLKKAMSSGVKEGVLIDLNIKTDQEQKNRIVMLKELQIHPAKRYFLHADFYEIAMDEKITAPVSVHFVGKAKGVETGGILRQFKREIEVRCLPSQIPDDFEIDVSELEIGKTIYVKEIRLEEGVEILEGPDLPMVTVLPPTVLKKEEAEEEVAEEGKEAPVEGVKEEGEEKGD